MKDKIILSLLITIILVNCYSQDNIFLYEIDNTLFFILRKIETPIKSFNEKLSFIKNIINSVENEYNNMIKIDYEIVKIYDKEENCINGIIFNFSLKRPIYEYFSEFSHRFTGLEKVILNAIQPFANNWEIEYVVIKINGVFLHLIKDFNYWYFNTIWTRHNINSILKLANED